MTCSYYEHCSHAVNDDLCNLEFERCKQYKLFKQLVEDILKAKEKEDFSSRLNYENYDVGLLRHIKC